MSEIHYVERVPRRSDFCGRPPCSICYDPVITDEQQAPTFQEVMKEIYGEGPAPQSEQEYEWAHAAAHQCREELEACRPDGETFADESRAQMMRMQIDDLLKQAKKASEAPKPLNRVNLDDMPMKEQTETVKEPVPTTAELILSQVQQMRQRDQQMLDELYNSQQMMTYIPQPATQSQTASNRYFEAMLAAAGPQKSGPGNYG
jgi:hypothetical protein